MTFLAVGEHLMLAQSLVDYGVSNPLPLARPRSHTTSAQPSMISATRHGSRSVPSSSYSRSYGASGLSVSDKNLPSVNDLTVGTVLAGRSAAPSKNEERYDRRRGGESNHMRSRCTGTCKPAAVTFALLALLWSTPATAQTVGARLGVSVDPDQFYFGGHLETAPLIDRLRFRPNVEVGIGDDVTLIAFNFEFAYAFPSRRPWNLYLGAGPALNIYDDDDDTSADGGFNILIGAAHRQGLFVEFKIGTMSSPDLKFGVGYTFR